VQKGNNSKIGENCGSNNWQLASDCCQLGNPLRGAASVCCMYRVVDVAVVIAVAVVVASSLTSICEQRSDGNVKKDLSFLHF